MFGWLLTEKEKNHREASQYHLKYGVSTDDYVKQYEEWLQTPPRERSELPPILENKGKAVTREQLWQEQQDRLKADIPKLATGEMTPHTLADVLYGDNWQEELKKYKEQNNRYEQVMTGVIACTGTGAIIYACWLLVWMARFVKKSLSIFKRLVFRTKNKEETENQKQTQEDSEKSSQEPEINEKQDTMDKPIKFVKSKGKKQEISANPDGKLPLKVKGGNKNFERTTNKLKISNSSAKFNKLLTDEKTTAIRIATRWGSHRSETDEQSKATKDSTQQGMSIQPGKDYYEIDDQSKPLDTAINEFTQQVSAIQSAKQSSKTDEQPKQINSAINELTEQVSAIREYAACQQDRLEKLQDGYDWNIIKTFCLRVIRCIDNLESRINRFGEDDGRAVHLEEIRDELIFALESSGVEQFEPEVNREYRGQEKFAEAVKDKQKSDNPKQAGNIAKVIRPGYQYFINEENVKVVRPAQVKLYA